MFCVFFLLILQFCPSSLLGLVVPTFAHLQPTSHTLCGDGWGGGCKGTACRGGWARTDVLSLSPSSTAEWVEVGGGRHPLSWSFSRAPCAGGGHIRGIHQGQRVQHHELVSWAGGGGGWDSHTVPRASHSLEDEGCPALHLSGWHCLSQARGGWVLGTRD
jgi:hypothetical protein